MAAESRLQTTACIQEIPGWTTPDAGNGEAEHGPGHLPRRAARETEVDEEDDSCKSSSYAGARPAAGADLDASRLDGGESAHVPTLEF